MLNKTQIRLLSCFILSKSKRKAFRKKHLDILKASSFSPTIHFGKNVEIAHGVMLEENINIGDYSYIKENSKIFRNTSIGKFCSIATDVTVGASAHPTDFLSTHPFQYVPGYLEQHTPPYTYDTFRPTSIGHDVWIGCHSIIIGGIQVGNGAVIGAGSIVTKNVPPYAIVVGAPARILRYRFSQDIIERLQNTQWWNLPEENIKNLPYNQVEECLKWLEKRSRGEDK